MQLAEALGILTGREDDEIELAADPQLLSFQVAAALELAPEAKRALLALRSTTARLRQLATLVRPLAADAERRAAVRQRAKGNGRGGAPPANQAGAGSPPGPAGRRPGVPGA